MKWSFSMKVVGLVLVTVLFLSGTIFGLTYYFVSQGFEDQIRKEMEVFSTSVQTVLEDYRDKVTGVAHLLAIRPDVGKAIEIKDTAFLQRVSKEVLQKHGLGLITIADKEGQVVARGHSEKVGDSVSNQLNVKKALAGEPFAGIEQGTVVKFSLRAGYPVKVNNQVVGSITSGIDLSSDNRFVDEIKKRFGLECTIFHEDTRVSTTQVKDGKRLIGTKMDNPQVSDTVLGKGQKFIRKNKIMGKDYHTAYWPILCADGRVGGMLFIGKDFQHGGDSFRGIALSILASIGIVGGLMVVLGFFFARSTTRPILRMSDSLTQGAEEVAAHAGYVAAASQALAQGTSEQAAGLQEISSSLEEMTSMTKQNAENAHQGRGMMSEAQQIVGEVNQKMTHMAGAMGEITKSSEETGKIIKTIDEIAFQTNLLALNAAVEAARAGEAGAGFAVVADEVRNLAMRASEAAKNTNHLIEDTVKAVKKGKKLTLETQEAFKRNMEISGKIGKLIDEISAASQEQAQGVGQVSKAVSEMDRVTQQNNASSEELASTAEQMNSQAMRMKGWVGDLADLFGVGRHGTGVKGETDPSAPGLHSLLKKWGPEMQSASASQGKGINREQGIRRF
jgi:methyl-accepting chemotaxis protein